MSEDDHDLEEALWGIRLFGVAGRRAIRRRYILERLLRCYASERGVT